MSATDVSTLLASYPARYFAAWSGGDPGVVDELFAESLDWQDPSLPGPITDRAGARAFMEGSFAAFPDMRFEQLGEALVSSDDRVAAEWRMTGTHQGEFNGVPATGKAFDVLGTDVFTVTPDGLASAIHAYWDVTTLLRQLGLVEG